MWQLLLNVPVTDVQRELKCVHPFVRQFVWLVFVCGLNKSPNRRCMGHVFDVCGLFCGETHFPIIS